MKWTDTNQSEVMSSIIGPDARFEGNLTITGSVRVDGTLEGVLISKGTVTIGREGSVRGEIEANEVIIGGKVVGSVLAGKRLVLEETAVLEGNMATESLTVSEGATFNGQSGMGSQAVKELRTVLSRNRDVAEEGESRITLYDDDGLPLDDDESSAQAS